jgi:glycosyltransferase involved in cell wall biosynthesis
MISIIIPARNEAEDIAPTLDRCLALDYEPKEIIVVDDSTDDTPAVVASYADRGVRLIHRDVNSNGCCGARNLGMQVARGDILVLMNADNRPRPDFLRHLLPHYADGADFVIVGSTVLNKDNMWGRYIHASSMTHIRYHPDHTWSEGFSCRKSAAQTVGFIPGDFPIPFCRDNLLGERLTSAGYKKHIDRSIPMEHVTPSTLRTFWRNRVWRGTFSSPYAYYMRGMSLPVVALREAAKALRTVLHDLLLFPVLWRSLRHRSNAHLRWDSVPSLVAASLIQDAAIIVGSMKGLGCLVRVMRRGQDVLRG